MGIFSKESEKISAGSSRNRFRDVPVAIFKKMMLLISLVFGFAIYNQAFIPQVEPQTKYLNMIFTGEIGFLRGFKLTAYQGVEMGTKNVFVFVENFLTYITNAQPVDAIFLAGIPLFIIFLIWLVPTTMLFDLIDQRKKKETPYILQILVTVLVVILASGMINGAYMFHDWRANQQCDSLSAYNQSNQTFLKCNIGNIEHTVSPDEYTSYDLESNEWQMNMSDTTTPDFMDSGNQTGNNTMNQSRSGGLLGGVLP